jgi:hypothetical protein
LEDSEDTENVINAHDKGTHEDMNTDQDLQGKHSSLNEAVSLDVEETVSVSNSDQDGSEEDRMNVDSKDKEVIASEIPGKVTENDLEVDDVHPSECIVNSIAEEEMKLMVNAQRRRKTCKGRIQRRTKRKHWMSP